MRTLGNRSKSSTSSVSGRDWNFVKSSRVKFRDKVRGCKIREAQNGESPLFRIERHQIRWLGHVIRNSHGVFARRVLLATPTVKQPKRRLRTRCHAMTRSPTSLCPILVWSQQNYHRLLKNVMWATSSPPAGLLLPRTSTEEKQVWKWINECVLYCIVHFRWVISGDFYFWIYATYLFAHNLIIDMTACQTTSRRLIAVSRRSWKRSTLSLHTFCHWTSYSGLFCLTFSCIEEFVLLDIRI